MNKQKQLDIAEVINAYRVVPRLMLALYGYMCLDAYQIAMMATATDHQVAFAQVIWGAGAVWFTAYAATGNKR
jgi:hypothetical protein